MTKHRLELFSDGVFAIVLTLLVLDLKPPAAHGLAGVWEITPQLIVHALTFALVGLGWKAHHGALASVTEINDRTVRWNLLALFGLTLIPFAARVVAERPLEALGPSLLSGCYSLYALAAVQMRRTAKSSIDDDPERRRVLRFRYRLSNVFGFFGLICAVLAWRWPVLGYAMPIMAIGINLFLRSVGDEINRVVPAAPGAEPATLTH